MLSTSKALKEWAPGMLKLLQQLKDQSATLPNRLEAPLGHVGAKIGKALGSFERLKSPVATWGQLLQQQFPYLVLAACSGLMTADTHCVSATFYAMLTASVLLERAAADLPPPHAASSSSSRQAGSGGSSHSIASSCGLKAMLLEQLEKSGLLQQLPVLLSSNFPYLQGRAADDPSGLEQYTSTLFRLLDAVQQLHPSFLTDHEAGQQCLAPAMQLSLGSMQFLSSVVGQAGKQDRMVLEGWLDSCWEVADSAADAVNSLLERFDQLGDAARAVLGAQQISQWVSMHAAVHMLMGFLQLQQATATRVNPLATASSNSNSSARSSSSSSSSKANRHQHGRKPSAGRKSREKGSGSGGEGNALGEEWLPAALAPSMPAAYSMLLENLGCSREVGLWMAALLLSGEEMEAPGPPRSEWGADRVLASLGLNGRLVCARASNSAVEVMQRQQGATPKLAAVHLSISAASLQWLSSMPPGRLLPGECALMCQAAADTCRRGCDLLEQQQQQPSGDWDVTAQLSAAVLERLLQDCRELPGSGNASSSSSSSSNRGCCWASDSIKLLQSCRDVVRIMAHTLRLDRGAVAPETACADSASSQQDSLRPGIKLSSALCSKLLQDCVRLVTAAAVAAPDFDDMLGTLTIDIIRAVTPLLGGVEDSLDDDLPARIVSGPLAAPVAVGPAVKSGSSALQLLGLLSSLLKLYENNSSTSDVVVCTMASAENPQLQDVRTSVMIAISPIMAAALRQDSTASQLSTNPCSSSSSSSSTGGSEATTACCTGLPWLALLGRWCRAAAVLVQHDQGSQELDGGCEGPVPTLHPWQLTELDLQMNLRWLQVSLEGVVGWLAAAGTTQQLVALGYPPEELQRAAQQLAEVGCVLRSVDSDLCDIRQQHTSADSGGSAVVTVFAAAQKQLQAAARILVSFAVPYVCNNPACSNVAGPSEAQLVGGRSCICGGCRTARYCGRACQRAAWRLHKPLCNALAEAATEGTSSG